MGLMTLNHLFKTKTIGIFRCILNPLQLDEYKCSFLRHLTSTIIVIINLVRHNSWINLRWPSKESPIQQEDEHCKVRSSEKEENKVSINSLLQLHEPTYETKCPREVLN